jgi:hypothetical protein
MKSNAPNLTKALSGFLPEGITKTDLSQILEYASLRGFIYYEQAKELIDADPEEALLAAEEWRLLLPSRTAKSMAWEDRLLILQEGELFEMPNIIIRLVKDALASAIWRTEEMLRQLFQEMGDPAWNLIPQIFATIAQTATNNTISGNKITKVCLDFGFSNKADWLIAELKGAGAISPKLSSPSDVMKAGSPLYELNPSLTHPFRAVSRTNDSKPFA